MYVRMIWMCAWVDGPERLVDFVQIKSTPAFSTSKIKYFHRNAAARCACSLVIFLFVQYKQVERVASSISSLQKCAKVNIIQAPATMSLSNSGELGLRLIHILVAGQSQDYAN